MSTLELVLVTKPPFAKPVNIMRGIPFELAGVRPSGLPHSLYEELWHLNYWQEFSLALIRGENPSLPLHSSEAFPKDNDTLTESTWQALLENVGKGLDRVLLLSQDETGLRQTFRPDRTVEDELIVIANHNAYHFGRMVSLRQILGIWSADLGDSW